MGYHVSCSKCEYEDRKETVVQILEQQETHQRRENETHVLEFTVED